MFKRIALIANKNGQKIIETLQSVSKYLLNRNIDIVLNSFSANLMQDSDLRTVPDEQLPLQCDMAIAIGGDGTMLWAAQLLADYDVPLLGINRGRLGFLADIPADSVEEHLQQILDGHYIEDERIQLHCQVERDNKIIKESHAFNDIIVQKWNIAKLIELTTYVDQTLLHSQRSDGMIISSPTGSTAYALSGGGPILHPALDALVLVPICPHTLSNRPIVIDGNSRIEIVVGTPEIDHASLTCDGEISCNLLTGDRIIIYKKNKKIRLIHPPGYDHFSTLRAKLQWG